MLSSCSQQTRHKASHFPGLTSALGLTSDPEEIKSALKLVYQAYLHSGLIKPNQHAVRVTPFHLLETSEVLVARQGRDIACTLTLVQDGELGLPMDAVFEDLVASRREQGIVCAEVTCLADRRASRRESFSLLVKLMSFAIQCAEARGVEELMIAIHPRHARFYQEYWGAKILTDVEQKYPDVCDNPAVALSLNIQKTQSSNFRASRRLFDLPFSANQFYRKPWSADLIVELSEMVNKPTLPVTYQSDRQYHQDPGVLAHWLSVA